MAAGGDDLLRRLARHDALLVLAHLQAGTLDRKSVHRQEHARRAFAGVMPRMRNRAWRFHMCAQRPFLVRLRQRRYERHELRHEDERAAEAPEPAPEAGPGGGGNGHHINDTNDTTVRSTSL